MSTAAGRRGPVCHGRQGVDTRTNRTKLVLYRCSGFCRPSLPLRAKMEVIRRNTDYALRIMVRLARDGHQGPWSTRRLAEAEGVSVQLAAKLLQRLGSAGLVTSRRGKQGGFALKGAPAQIALDEVIAAIQGPVLLSRCVAAEGVCALQSRCVICRRLRLFQRQLQATLAGTTLAQLAADAAPTAADGETVQIACRAGGRQGRVRATASEPAARSRTDRKMRAV